MKRWVLVVAVAALVAAVALLARPRRPEWTTASPEAMAEFELGVEAARKVYYAEAREHYERAVKADPNFAAAKLFLLEYADGKENEGLRKGLAAELRALDLDQLTDRERFLISYRLTTVDKGPARADAVLEAYLKEHPDDPWALNYRANRALHDEDWERARADYRRAVEVAPDLVFAYNQLGYLEMARGSFAEAEAMFKKYRFVAPDQANPHDSLGELLTITGRYEEAEQEFEEALRVKPDFCASLTHLVTLHLIAGRLDRADAAVERARGSSGCTPQEVEYLDRSVALWRAAHAQDWQGLLAAAHDETDGYGSSHFVLVYTALCRVGRLEEAVALESKLKATVDKLAKDIPAAKRAPLEASVHHLAGTRALVRGAHADAAAEFRRADATLLWRNVDEGIFKLYNLALLGKAVRAAGERGEADATATALRAVNPRFAADVEAGRSLLGPERPS